ncbi:hypothetical protein B0H21DRAFT_874422 [Amylocystis lapponica]|nr:hypothetical protein B0H21DRAFT_874422 [Amylocystis lapponica]
MSLVDLRVELPAYSHSFTIRVQQSAPVRDVKQEISRACPGAPRADGLRLVWRGRLLNDDEVVENIWKSPDDSRIIHLAVHPSAWTGSPPGSTITPPDAQSPSRTSLPPHTTQPPLVHRSQPSLYASPLTHVIVKHNIALGVLTTGPVAGNPPESESWRTLAVDTLRSHGWAWPAILDEEYPLPGNYGEGVKYERVTLGPNHIPTTQSWASYPWNTPINLNHHLQQLGVQPLHLAPGQQPHAHANADFRNRFRAAAPPEVRAIRVRALVIPLIMLVFRTVLLMYFFSPSKRPVFGILLTMWMLYEAWGAIRVVLLDPRGVGGAQPGNVNGVAGAGGQPPNGQAAQPAAGQAGHVPGGLGAPNRSHTQVQALFDGLSHLNLAEEDVILDAPIPAPAPSWGHKLKTFATLLVLTLNPAVWDHRRTALRRREGRMRTEANAREEPQDAEGAAEDAARARARRDLVARHERRPGWVREYVQMVQTTEWPDDA